MEINKIIFRIAITGVMLLLILIHTKCKRETTSPLTHADSLQTEYSLMKTGIYQIFKTGKGSNTPPYYLWYDKVKTVNLDSFKTPFALLDSLVYKPLDRYSYLASKSQQNQLFNEGQYIGIGFGFKLDASNLFRVTFVFNNSPLVAEGVQRGWIIKSVNGVTVSPSSFNNAAFGSDAVGVSNTIVFEDLQGIEHTIVVAKKIITMNTVLTSRVLTFNNEKIGYLAFESFLEPSVAELKSAFKAFKSQRINDLVVDLRYNGGGRVDVADSMASAIAGDIAKNKVFVYLSYNDQNTNLNSQTNFASSGYGFGLNRIFFITSEGTASASELMINGCKPYMNVYMVGAKTYGKPVGMSGFEFKDYDWVLMPIIFETTNANHEGGYFNGIEPNSYVKDDLVHDLGDPQEACLSSVLSFIQNGTFPPSTKSMSTSKSWNIQQIRGLRSEIGAY
jgi:carboxyl-terminal processing protease